MVPPNISNTAVAVFSYVDTIVGAMVGAAIAYMFAEVTVRMRVRARFNEVISRQRQRCRPLYDDAEFTLDDSLDRATLQVLERVREEVVPN